jgi:hypothetical protein
LISGKISSSNGNSISLPYDLYNNDRDSNLTLDRQNRMVDLTLKWYNTQNEKEKLDILRLIDLERRDARGGFTWQGD